MKKKSYKLFIFIGIAVLAVLIMYFISTPPPPPEFGENLPKPVKDFRAKCDSMKIKSWNAVNYNNLKMQLASLKSQQVFSTTDGLALEDYLDLAYANTMQVACAEWKNSDGSSANVSLLQSMERISSNPKCASFVVNDIDIMRAYFKAVEMPGRVAYFLKQEFNPTTYNQLMNDLGKYCGKSEISHFSRLLSISSTQQEELNSFKSFAETYKGRRTFYDQNMNDFDAKLNISELCPNQNQFILNYQFYLTDIQSIGICD